MCLGNLNTNQENNRSKIAFNQGDPMCNDAGDLSKAELIRTGIAAVFIWKWAEYSFGRGVGLTRNNK